MLRFGTDRSWSCGCLIGTVRATLSGPNGVPIWQKEYGARHFHGANDVEDLKVPTDFWEKSGRSKRSTDDDDKLILTIHVEYPNNSARGIYGSGTHQYQNSTASFNTSSQYRPDSLQLGQLEFLNQFNNTQIDNLIDEQGNSSFKLEDCLWSAMCRAMYIKIESPELITEILDEQVEDLVILSTLLSKNAIGDILQEYVKYGINVFDRIDIGELLELYDNDNVRKVKIVLDRVRTRIMAKMDYDNFLIIMKFAKKRNDKFLIDRVKSIIHSMTISQNQEIWIQNFDVIMKNM